MAGFNGRELQRIQEAGFRVQELQRGQGSGAASGERSYLHEHFPDP
jgi:hypothetical protein